MAINGITFDRMRVTTKSDALLYYSMLDNNDRIVKGYKNELNVSATGLSVFVSTGACVVQGRLIDVDEEELVSVSANDTGYICLVIDLTQVNTSEGEAGTPGYTPVNNQVRLEVVKTLVQQDLFEEGKLYTFPLASFTSTGTTVVLTKIDHNQRIVESGSNSNGNWTKFADGTMICRVNKACSKPNAAVGSGAIYGSSSNFWEFPQVFLEIPSVTSNVISGATYAWTSQGSYQTSVSGTSVIILHPSSGGANTNPLTSLIAIGRWK